jgi:hypothetical protein
MRRLVDRDTRKTGALESALRMTTIKSQAKTFAK